MQKKVSRVMGLPVATLAAALMLNVLFPAQLYASQLNEPEFKTQQFANRWIEQDRLVGAPGVPRFFTWGPEVEGAKTIGSEPYKESPDGRRLVQYFDKGRMEINQYFTQGTVSTGLLVRDLVSGQRQDGDNTFLSLPPSQTQVAGDDVSVNPSAPVYASFKNVITFGTPDANSKSSTPNAALNQLIDKAGTLTTFTPPEQLTVGAYQNETGHNIARVFVDFMNIRGAVTNPNNSQRLENQPVYTSNPTVNVFGYAVSEPYWVRTKVAGVELTVLVQLFQRRVLTYNPSLSGQKVEMGNLGQHYYKWRYVENASTASPGPTVPASGCLPAATTGGNLVQTCITRPDASSATVFGRLVVNGKIVTGVPMNTQWAFFGKLVTCDSMPSEASGVASCTLNLTNEPKGTRVEVLVSFNYNNQIYQSTLDFTSS